MSAIWGMVALDGQETVREQDRMIFETVYEKCKTDACNTVMAEGAYFGCGIQFVTPQSYGERLPLANEDRTVLFTADGVLDNRREIIRVLEEVGCNKGELEEAADGTLMYLSYLRWGTDCVKLFRGVFSMAIWEAEKKRLVLVSDQVAGRCLYYARRGNLVAFSTLQEPLLRLFPETEFNEEYFKDFLLAEPSVIYVVPGETPYQDMFLMKPATVAEFDEAGNRERVYWNQEDGVPGYEKKVCKSAKEYRESFFALYEACVRDALVSSGEVGIAMSSGLDSSTIGVLAAKELAKKGKSLYSYTFVPYIKQDKIQAGNALYDESVYVKKLADRYSNIRTRFLNNQGKNLFEDMEFCMKLLELPYKTGTFPNHYEMCTEGAKDGCRVFLNGGFGNNTVSFGEINHILFELYSRKRYGTFFRWLSRFCRHENISRRKALSSLLKKYRVSRQQKDKSITELPPENFYLLPDILRNYCRKERFSKDKRQLLSTVYLDKERYTEHLRATSLLMYLGVFETKFGLATGMLLRDPTKDIRLISFCRNLPYELFAYRGMPRWLIRSSFRTLLPTEFLNRWRQKGLLNIDWMDRIYRDREWLMPELLSAIGGMGAEDWADMARVHNDVKSFGKSKEKDIHVISHLCALYAVAEFTDIQNKI